MFILLSPQDLGQTRKPSTDTSSLDYHPHRACNVRILPAARNIQLIITTRAHRKSQQQDAMAMLSSHLSLHTHAKAHDHIHGMLATKNFLITARRAWSNSGLHYAPHAMRCEYWNEG